jgi:ESCRT-II complex subunit VPS22
VFVLSKGTDPLLHLIVCNDFWNCDVAQKGFWTELLGVGDFYYELAVQIVDVSLKTRQINGGLISLIELTQRLKQMRGSTAQDISTDDIERAVKKLKVLGKGFEILSVGSTKMLQTVPCELNTDHMTVMVLAQEKGYVTASELMREMKWTQSRVDVVMGLLLQEGMVWVDDQASERQFWFPSIFSSINKVEI